MNILLIQLKRIGDLILTTPAIAALHETFPGAELSLAISNDCRELVPAIPGLRRTLVAKGSIADAPDWLTLASERYDYCLDFTGNDRSALVTFLSHAERRIAFRRVQRSPVRALSYNEFVDCRVRSVHTIDYHLALLSPLGIRDASPAVRLVVPDTAREEAQRLQQEYDIGNDFVICHPGSARAEKFWLANRWVEVIGHCARELQLTCVLTGGNSAMEEEHLAEIKSLTRYPIVDLSGQLDLLTLTALIGEARLLLGVDSAPMHLAAAMQTPQVVLFGPTNPFHWRPRASPAAIIQAGSPEPLTSFSPDQPRVPTKEISTQQVIGAMESLLSASAAPSS